jgi:Na+/proline symporter
VALIPETVLTAAAAAAGMNIFAAAFLLPVGVMFYTAQGGLKASYVASWANTGAILIALVVFGMMTYASGKYPVGSIGRVWENLQVGDSSCYITCCVTCHATKF